MALLFFARPSVINPRGTDEPKAIPADARRTGALRTADLRMREQLEAPRLPRAARHRRPRSRLPPPPLRRPRRRPPRPRRRPAPPARATSRRRPKSANRSSSRRPSCPKARRRNSRAPAKGPPKATPRRSKRLHAKCAKKSSTHPRCPAAPPRNGARLLQEIAVWRGTGAMPEGARRSASLLSAADALQG